MTMTTDTAPAAEDLVTEEILDAAVEAIADPAGDYAQVFRDELLTALRAVAPMIAARSTTYLRNSTYDAVGHAVAAEREAIAQIVKETDDWDDCLEASNHILAAIRARGETPTKAPGEIDWSAMDKED
jgi:hypothetical protein